MLICIPTDLDASVWIDTAFFGVIEFRALDAQTMLIRCGTDSPTAVAYQVAREIGAAIEADLITRVGAVWPPHSLHKEQP